MNPFCLFEDSNHNTQNTPQPTHGIVFIDSRVDNYQILKAGASRRLQVFILDPRQDGVVQISHILSDWFALSYLYIVSQGTSGCLPLGTARLSAVTLNGYAQPLKRWANALSEDADLVLCDSSVAKGDEGTILVQKLRQIVETNVIAWTDLPGSW